MTALETWNDKQLDLVRRTVAKDCNPDEFRQFIHICQGVRLDPLRRQIYCFVFNKTDPKRRQMTVVTSIGGYRSIAERTGSYRPDSAAPRLEISADAKSSINPLGIIRCEVTVFKHSHGEWFPVVGEAYWEEYVPTITNEDGVAHIDRKKTGWIKMPRIMIAKCAESNALRKAWPDDFAALVSEEEIDRAHSLDAWEGAEAGASAKRMEAIGGGNRILVSWEPDKPLQPVKVGEFYDAAMKFIREHKEEPSVVLIWKERNRHGLQEYWGREKDGALALKQELEKVETDMKIAMAAE